MTDDKGLLKRVVKIKYSKKSLTKEEKVTFGGLTRYLYFYGDQHDYEQRMTDAWRPGAKAEIFNYRCQKELDQHATPVRGVWTIQDPKIKSVAYSEI